jgi:iron complex transport system ATP-binding protein
MAHAIVVNNLGHTFNGSQVLSQVSFHVELGEFFVIIGPNGSGKTTLLRLITGLMPLKQGEITIQGRSIRAQSPRALARCIAYVPQHVPAEFPFSVIQVVLMGRAPHLGLLGFEGPGDLDRAHQAMAITGIEHLAGRRLSQLSGGERQRVFIARAICQQPKILILDEPTAALDLSHQVRVMDLMEQLQQAHALTIVMVSHDLNLAAMYAQRLLLLAEGRIAGCGRVSEVIDYALLERVYRCTLLVDHSPLGDYPRVHLVPRRHLPHRSGVR